MSLHGTGACGDSKCQFFFKRGKYVEHEKLLLNLTDIKVFLRENEKILCKTFLKKTISIHSIYLDHYIFGKPCLLSENVYIRNYIGNFTCIL